MASTSLAPLLPRLALLGRLVAADTGRLAKLMPSHQAGGELRTYTMKLARDLVKTNKKYFEGFSVMCRLRKGTHVQISHLEVVSMRTKRRSGEALPRH